MIIRIGEVEWHDLQRHLTVPKIGACKHLRLQYIDHGELLKCLDCDKQISAVWALKFFFTQYQVEKERLEAVRTQLKADEERLVTHKAALAVQDAWRRHHLVPTCPHCNKGIMPPDGLGKKGAVNPDYYESRPLKMPMNGSIEK
jgi:hypothetical protein